MTERDEIKTAINLLVQGRRDEAAKELLRLESKVTDKDLRFEIAGALISAADPISHNEKLMAVTKEAISTARGYGRHDLEAKFMCRLAEFLSSKNALLYYQRKNLKLVPGWIEFATESDRQRYKHLSSEIQRVEEEIRQILDHALQAGQNMDDKETIGTCLMARGAILSMDLTNYKMENLDGTIRAKLWLKVPLLRYPFFEQLIVFPGKEGKKIKSLINEMTENYVEAAKAFEQIDNSLSGYAYYGLANHLKSAYKFRDASNYLEKAEVVANKYNDLLLAKQVAMLRSSIVQKNKDIPDYVNGETRKASE